MRDKNLLEKDRKYIWHPYTQMKDYAKEDHILIVKAEGIKLYDAKGNVYFDTISSWWCNVHGHNHPKIKEAINRQLEKFEHILFAGFTHESAILLGEKLVQITPKNLTKVFYSDNGSTACEVALKMSYQYWKNIGKKRKEKFVSLKFGYHGDTLGAMSVGSFFEKKFSSLLLPSYKVPSPYCYRCPFNKNKENCGFECVTPVEEIFEKKGQEIAGIILEPLVQGAGGMIVYPIEYLKKVASLANKYAIHLIIDEVATGFGRTGKMFAVEYAKVEPDFMCLSKGITNGTLPLGATLTTDEIYNAFYDDYAKDKTFYHGHTYTANPLSTSVALASLEIFDKEKTLQRINKEIIPIFHQKLEELRDFPLVGDVRYIGMIGGIELVKNKKTKEPFSFEERIGWKIYKNGLKEGLILRPLGNIIYLFLPLSIKSQELTEIFTRLHKTLCVTG